VIPHALQRCKKWKIEKARLLDSPFPLVFLIKYLFTFFCHLIGFDACFYKPCKNHGVCVSGLGHDFFCQCPHGFQGQHCEHLITHKRFNKKFNRRFNKKSNRKFRQNGGRHFGQRRKSVKHFTNTHPRSSFIHH